MVRSRIGPGLVLLLVGCIADSPPERVLVPVEEIKGFAQADHLAAVRTFASGCHLIEDSPLAPADAWEPLCAEAQAIGTAEGAAFFLKARFIGQRINREDGLMTGYYEPVFEARAEPDPPFDAPVLTPPDDLVTVELGVFRDSLDGQRIAGRVIDGRLRPYEDRAALENKAPENAGTIGYMRPDDLFFLQIQGSGVLAFPDGMRQIGYASQNGHPYHAIGRTLVEEGHLALEEVTMQSIREWLAAAPPEEAARIRHTNPSYIFFTDRGPATEGGPLGTQGIPLTPRVSVAVDRTETPLGAMLWIEGENETHRFESLAVAQDTGGAIRGPSRVDLFVGRGDEAGALAGELKLPVTVTLLLPRSVTDGEPDPGPGS
jgi:membrane-bound lytic murein transglycosylase A